MHSLNIHITNFESTSCQNIDRFECVQSFRRQAVSNRVTLLGYKDNLYSCVQCRNVCHVYVMYELQVMCIWGPETGEACHDELCNGNFLVYVWNIKCISWSVIMCVWKYYGSSTWMYKRGSLFRLFYFINFTAELKRRPDRRYDCESLTAASCNGCQVHLYLCFFKILFCFICFLCL